MHKSQASGGDFKLVSVLRSTSFLRTIPYSTSSLTAALYTHRVRVLTTMHFLVSTTSLLCFLPGLSYCAQLTTASDIITATSNITFTYESLNSALASCTGYCKAKQSNRPACADVVAGFANITSRQLIDVSSNSVPSSAFSDAEQYGIQAAVSSLILLRLLKDRM